MSGSIHAQQTPVANTQALLLLQNSYSAIAGRISLKDVTLNGTARRVAGSDDESGSVTLEALLSGESLMKLAAAAGQYTEVVSITSTRQPAGSWAGPDGIVHAMAQHNLFTDSTWFFPALTLNKLLASSATVATLVGQDTKIGVSVTHVSVYRQISGLPAQTVTTLQGLSRFDMYLDPTTLLPLAFDFSTHPDNNLLLNIPVEIQFSDYRVVNGVQVPFHIEKYLNNSLFLSIQLQNVTINSGLAASAFAIQ